MAVGGPRRINMKKAAGRLKFGGAGRPGGGLFFNWPDYNVWHELRFLGPWHEDTDEVWTQHVLHYKQIGERRSGFAGLDPKGNKAITCSEFHLGEPCAVCQLIAWCEERSIPGVSGIMAKDQFLTNIVYENMLKVWGDTKKTIIKKLKTYLNNPRLGSEMFDIETGRNVEIVRTGDKEDLQSIEYDMQVLDPSPIVLPTGWEKKVPQLSKFIQTWDRNEIIEVLIANLGGHIPVKDCFRRPARRSSTTKPPARKTKPAVRKTKAAKKTTKKKVKSSEESARRISKAAKRFRARARR
jgi:hypothetical protein